MKTFALVTLVMAAAANAASIYGPDMSLIKADDCASPTRFVVNQPDGRYETDYPYNQIAIVTGYVGPSLPPAAFQLGCDEASFLVDTRELAVHEGSFAQYKVTWAIPSWATLSPSIARIVADWQPTRVRPDAPVIRPWAHEGDPDLILQAWVRIPTVVVGEGANVQYNLSFYILDTISGQVFDYIVNIYNNDAFGPGMGPSYDGLSPFISTMLPPQGSTELRQRYYTLSPYSSGSSITPWSEPRFFRIHVGRHNLVNAINDVNAEYDTGLSEDPSNYLLIDAGVIQEHTHPPGSSVLVASSLRDFGVYMAANENPAGDAQAAADLLHASAAAGSR